jgi:hypothetical protein
MGADQSTPLTTGGERKVSSLRAQFDQASADTSDWIFGRPPPPVWKRPAAGGAAPPPRWGQPRTFGPTALSSKPQQPATSPTDTERTASDHNSSIDSEADESRSGSPGASTRGAERAETKASAQREEAAPAAAARPAEGYAAEVSKLGISSAERDAARSAFMQHIRAMQAAQQAGSGRGAEQAKPPVFGHRPAGASSSSQPPVFKSGEGAGPPLFNPSPAKARSWTKMEAVKTGKDPYKLGKYDVITTQLHGREVVKADACAGISYYRGIDEELAEQTARDGDGSFSA